MELYRGKVLALALLPCFGLILSGCSNQQANASENSNRPSAISNVVTNSTSSHSDGRIISLTSINVPKLQPGLDAYKMMYWSNNVKVEALMAVPKDIAAALPLNVFCHGGWAAPQALTHDTPFDDGTRHTDNQADEEKWLANWAAPKVISVVPLYQGYGESDGAVEGIDVNTVNTNDLINIILNKYKITPNCILVYGISMGGAVSLKVASIRTDVSTVVANSPFVGWDIVGQWAEQNPNTPLGKSFLQKLSTKYGTFDLNNSKLKRVSIDYKNITAPVLLLQGKEDTKIPWQTVQILYEDMKKANKDVTLEMFEDGTHDLPHEPRVGNDIFRWFNRYGAWGTWE